MLSEQDRIIYEQIMSSNYLVGTIKLHIGPFSNNLPEEIIYESQSLGYRYICTYNYELIYDNGNLVGDKLNNFEEKIEIIENLN